MKQNDVYFNTFTKAQMFYEEIVDRINELEDCFYDLTDIFKGKSGTYSDEIHYT